MKKRIFCIAFVLAFVLSLAPPIPVRAEGSAEEAYAKGYEDGLAGREYDPELISGAYWFEYFEGHAEGGLDRLAQSSAEWDEKLKGGGSGYDDSDYQKYLARHDKVKDGPEDDWGYDEWKLWLDYLYEQYMYHASDDELLEKLEIYAEGRKSYQAWFEGLPVEDQFDIKQNETQEILDEIEIFAEIQRIADARAAAAASAAAGAYAAKPITLRIDGRVISTDSPPVIEDGRTLAPMRAVVEALGFVVAWDSGTQTVDIYSYATDELMISLKIGSNRAKVFAGISGVMDERILDVPAKLINGRTMVPVRFIAETLGCVVKWDPDAKIVDIFSAAG